MKASRCTGQRQCLGCPQYGEGSTGQRPDGASVSQQLAQAGSWIQYVNGRSAGSGWSPYVSSRYMAQASNQTQAGSMPQRSGGPMTDFGALWHQQDPPEAPGGRGTLSWGILETRWDGTTTDLVFNPGVDVQCENILPISNLLPSPRTITDDKYPRTNLADTIVVGGHSILRDTPTRSMAALVQTYPQQTATVTMLQTRPTSATGMISSNQGQNGHQYVGASSQAPRYGVGVPAGYRGSSAPVQQYAFTSTPTLNHTQSWQPQGQAVRTHNPNVHYGGRQFSSSTTNLTYNNSMGGGKTGARDDSAIPPQRNIVPAPRPHSAFLAGPTQQPYSPTSQSKATPDRYRRAVNPQQNQHSRSQSTTLPGNNGMPTAAQLYNGPNPQRSAVPNRPNSFYNAMPGMSMDDMHLLPQSPLDDSHRSRRRSMRSVDSDSAKPHQDKKSDGGSQTLRVVSNPAAHSRNGSSESIVSSRSSHSRPSSVS
ncbi:hypothetical protein NM208_g12722 [Fusarium decemcellulare]|uniref:Uncharacterized protein n=1 Tax=Fusarium decemcellulare TaxID=57161 RepID=A0ACC1RMJ5_9HYPO|nr:hypothetical protein NM208_g12722 [Fusarium decemcellulare]